MNGHLVERDISLAFPEEGKKNVSTVLKLNMADACVEDVQSDSYSSSFDNDDYSDDNHYQQRARGIFGDSDNEDNEVLKGFPIQMPENVNWTLQGQPVREPMICMYMTNLVKDPL